MVNVRSGPQKNSRPPILRNSHVADLHQPASEPKQGGAPGDGPSSLADSGLLCLLLLARYFGIPASGEQLRHQFGEPSKTLSDTDLLRAAGHLGFKAGLAKSKELGSEYIFMMYVDYGLTFLRSHTHQDGGL